MTRLTKKERLEIVLEHKRCNNLTKLARQFKVTRKTVKLWLEREAKTGDVNDMAGRGRKAAMDEATGKEAADMLTSGNYQGSQQVANTLHQQGKTKGGTAPHRTTIVRHAKRAAVVAGTPLRVARGKPAKQLSQAHMNKRLAFCKANKRTNWKLVMFTDRCKFHLRHPGTRVAATQWLYKGQRREAYTVSKPVVVNVYAGITKFGVTKLHFVAGTSKMDTVHKNKKGQKARNVTSSEYQEVVSKTFLPEGKILFASQSLSVWTLQQDNDPTHKKASAAALQEWNRENNSAISILPNWPPNSPDLNLIENVWAEVQRQVNDIKCCKLEDFKAVVTTTFKNLKQETINNLFSSMKTRIDTCIELQGGKTKY
jgi:hypothetical protein